jgi:hypothetical protein
MNKEPQSKHDHYNRVELPRQEYTSCLSFSIERMPNVDLFDAEDRFELPKLYTWPLPEVIAYKLVQKSIQYYIFLLQFEML